MEIILEGAIPAKKNSKQIFVNPKTNRPFIASSERYKEWHKIACFSINKQREKQIVPTEPVAITIELEYGDNRRRDCDNIVGSVLDTLQDCSILSDDSWQVVRSLKVVSKKSEKKQFICKITIDSFI